jgi:hypothetical protein
VAIIQASKEQYVGDIRFGGNKEDAYKPCLVKKNKESDIHRLN